VGLEVPSRSAFARSPRRQLCGLTSALDSSAGKEHRGPISKQRNAHLQTALVEAAKLAPRWNPQLAAVHERKCSAATQPGDSGRGTKVGGLSVAVDKSGNRSRSALRQPPNRRWNRGLKPLNPGSRSALFPATGDYREPEPAVKVRLRRAQLRRALDSRLRFPGKNHWKRERGTLGLLLHPELSSRAPDLPAIHRSFLGCTGDARGRSLSSRCA